MLSMVEVQRHKLKSLSLTSTTLLSVDPRIMSAQLHLPVQQWITVDSDDVSPAVKTWQLKIYSHIDQSLWTHHVMADLVRCKLQHTDEVICFTCAPFLHCEVCQMEVHVGIRRVEDRGNALVITKRPNLGHG